MKERPSVNTQCLDHWAFRTCLRMKTQEMYRYVINERKKRVCVLHSSGVVANICSTSQECSDGFKSGDADSFIYEASAIVVSSLRFSICSPSLMCHSRDICLVVSSYKPFPHHGCSHVTAGEAQIWLMAIKYWHHGCWIVNRICFTCAFAAATCRLPAGRKRSLKALPADRPPPESSWGRHLIGCVESERANHRTDTTLEEKSSRRFSEITSNVSFFGK